jgi:hypothetical protein
MKTAKLWCILSPHFSCSSKIFFELLFAPDASIEVKVIDDANRKLNILEILPDRFEIEQCLK